MNEAGASGLLRSIPCLLHVGVDGSTAEHALGGGYILAQTVMLALVAVGLASLVLGTFFGMRLQLARGRFSELRRTPANVQNQEAIEGAFSTAMQQRARFEAAGLVHHVRIVNTIQFVLTWNWDLSTQLGLLGTIPEEWSLDTAWRRKFLARTIALTAFETLTKLDFAFDPTNTRKTSIRRAIRTIGVDAAVGPRLDALHQQIAATLDQHRELLEGIRNNVIGHRHHEVATQLAWMRRADTEEIKRLANELLALTNAVVRSLTEVITTMSQQTTSIRDCNAAT